MEKLDKTNPGDDNNRGKALTTELSQGSLQESEAFEKIVSPNVDWFSCTTPDEELGARWWVQFCRWREKYPLLVREWHHQGGYVGQYCEGAHFGTSKRYGYLVKITGSTAREWINYLTLAQYELSNVNITRIDLRVDVLLNRPNENVAKNIYLPNQYSKRPKFKFYSSSGGSGQTVYVGSSQSPMFERIYDKGAERGMAAGFKWRYEIVFGKAVAGMLFEQLANAHKIGDLDQAILSLVKSWNEKKNIECPWNAETVVVPQLIRPKTTYESKLEWLEKYVRKSVQILCQSGYKSDVIKALGLGEYYE